VQVGCLLFRQQAECRSGIVAKDAFWENFIYTRSSAYECSRQPQTSDIFRSAPLMKHTPGLRAPTPSVSKVDFLVINVAEVSKYQRCQISRFCQI